MDIVTFVTKSQQQKNAFYQKLDRLAEVQIETDPNTLEHFVKVIPVSFSVSKID